MEGWRCSSSRFIGPKRPWLLPAGPRACGSLEEPSGLASDLRPPRGLVIVFVIVFVIGPLSEIDQGHLDNDYEYEYDYDVSELKLDQFVNFSSTKGPNPSPPTSHGR